MTDDTLRQRIAELLDPDMSAQEMRLHMGEMTAQEMRTARAAIRWANRRAEATLSRARAEGAAEEKERCAREAEECARQYDDGAAIHRAHGRKDSVDRCVRARSTARAIAAAIRSAPTPGERRDPETIEHYDDGTKVYLASYAGGGSREGSWSRLTLRMEAPDGREWFRSFVAEMPWTGPTDRPAPGEQDGGEGQ